MKKDEKKGYDYKHAHTETQALGMCRESGVFYTKVGMLKSIKSFLSEQSRWQNPGRPFKAVHISAPCHCVLVWPETALDQSVPRVIFPHLQHIPPLSVQFSTLAQMTSSPVFSQPHHVPNSDLKCSHPSRKN